MILCYYINKIDSTWLTLHLLLNLLCLKKKDEPWSSPFNHKDSKYIFVWEKLQSDVLKAHKNLLNWLWWLQLQAWSPFMSNEKGYFLCGNFFLVSQLPTSTHFHWGTVRKVSKISTINILFGRNTLPLISQNIVLGWYNSFPHC